MPSRNKFKFTNSEIASFAIALALLIGLCIYSGRNSSSESHDDAAWQAKADSLNAIIKVEKARADSLKRKHKESKRKQKKSTQKRVSQKSTPRNYLDEVID